jgi:hypothetical protein
MYMMYAGFSLHAGRLAFVPAFGSAAFADLLDPDD